MFYELADLLALGLASRLHAVAADEMLTQVHMALTADDDDEEDDDEDEAAAPEADARPWPGWTVEELENGETR